MSRGSPEACRSDSAGVRGIRRPWSEPHSQVWLPLFLKGDCQPQEAFPGHPCPPSLGWVTLLPLGHSQELELGYSEPGQRPPVLSRALHPRPTRVTSKESPEPHMPGRAKGSS